MEETGQPYERVLTDISKGAQKTPEYLAINPMGKVPAAGIPAREHDRGGMIQINPPRSSNPPAGASK